MGKAPFRATAVYLFLTVENTHGEKFSETQPTFIFKVKLSVGEISEPGNKDFGHT